MKRWPPPPHVGPSFFKAHGLGNDYLVFEEGDRWVASPGAVRQVCDRTRGVGSDGIVVLLGNRGDAVFRARMFNPDGSEFERSGNGLRVLGSYLTRVAPGEVGYVVEVGGDRVALTIHGRRDAELDIAVDMGHAVVGPGAVGLDPDVLDGEGRIAGPDGTPLRVVPVSVGNPHLVVLGLEPEEAALHQIGAFLVAHPALRDGANVQIAVPSGAGAARALVWERGVGPTSASGTSACAVAVAMVHAGLRPPSEISVEMPGGTLSVAVDEGLAIVLRGPVRDVFEGTLEPGFPG